MPKKPAKPIKLPKTLAACADRLFTVKNTRLKEAKKLDVFKAEESALKEHLIEKLPKSQASGIAGKVARATVETKKVPTVENWDLFYAHIKKTGEFDLMGRGINAEAIEARWAAKKKVPGVGTFNVVTVSINKL